MEIKNKWKIIQIKVFESENENKYNSRTSPFSLKNKKVYFLRMSCVT